MHGIEIINSFLGEFHKGATLLQAAPILPPVAGMRIFNQVNAIGMNSLVKQPERCNRLLHQMASIVNDNIDLRVIEKDLLNHLWVILTANDYFDTISLMHLAFRIDVQTNNPS